MIFIQKIIVLISFVLILTGGTIIWFMGKINQRFLAFENKIQEKKQTQEVQARAMEDDLKRGRDGGRKNEMGVLGQVEDTFLQNRKERAKMSKKFLEGQKEVFDKIGAFQKN